MQSATDREAVERVGAVLNDKWTLERLLGVGGMAAVYAGCHRNGARAAVKVLHRDLSRYREVRERFQREGYAANKVGHPGVVKVLDDDVISSGPDAGTAYLVMELLDGESLQDRLERGHPVGERDFLHIADEVLAVLEAAQEAGVVHRDLKPENLFFARDDGSPDKVRVKVLDFGLARLLSGQSITTYGLALGTPSFMSPEQAAGRLDEIDIRTDLFALAATGFRLRTGRRIHDGDDPVDLVTKMARLPAPPIRTLAPDASDPFARVIDRALEFRREDRYESATAMRKDVRRAISELDGAQHERRVSRAPPPSPPPRRQAPTLPRTKDPEPTIELSERDLVPPRTYGLDESIRIPKNHSVLPWMALILAGGIGVALWRDPTHGTQLLERARMWGSSLLSSPSSTPSAGTLTATPETPADAPADAGAARPAGGGALRSSSSASPSSSPPRAAPARVGPGSVQNLRTRH